MHMLEENPEDIEGPLLMTHSENNSSINKNEASTSTALVVQVNPVGTGEPTNVSHEKENSTKETESFPTVTEPGNASTGKKINNSTASETMINTEQVMNSNKASSACIQSKNTDCTPSSSKTFHKAQIHFEYSNLSTEKTPSKEASVTKNPSVLNTSASIKSLGLDIPSPFKRNLFWPGKDENADKRKRKLKEKIPYAITGNPWRVYNEKKEKEKEEKQREKERRAQAREEKKALKEAQKKQGKKKIAKSKQKQNETSSDDSESEIKYAESNDSYSTEDEEEVYIEQPNKKRKGSIKTDSDKVGNFSESEGEDVPLSKVLKRVKAYAKGNYVIIKYEDEYFPGVIENIEGNSFEIRTMTFSLGNTFKWPEKPDKIWYAEKDIIEKIDDPVLTNKRGFYSIKEMEKYLLFTI